MLAAVGLLLILISLYIIYDGKRPKNYPPGPMWLPILGNAALIERMRRKIGSLSKALVELNNEYGEKGVIGIRVGVDRQVVLNTAEAIRELATKAELDGRPKGIFYTYRSWGLRRGILLVDEGFWKEQRRFMMRHLREFGWGKSSMMEVIIQREVNSLLDYFKTEIKKSENGIATLPLHDAFGVSMLNSIWAMLAGKRYEPTDEEMRELQKILTDLFASCSMTGCLFSFFPLLRFIIPERSGYNQYMKCHYALWAFLSKEIDKHKETIDPNLNRDFLDVYIKELNTLGHDSHSTFSELQLMAICLDMFMAGSDTTNKSLSFGFLHFMREPQVVIKIQEELDRVVGRDRMPTLEDRPNLPYVEATVCEVLRIFSGQGVGLPHRALADCEFMGYTIPKDATIILNLHALHMNEKLWVEPKKFMPERFLDNENKIKCPDFFLPFGLGRRRCIGDTIAKTNLFYFITNLLHTFDFKHPKGTPLPNPLAIEGITPSTHPYESEISLRE